MTGQTISHYRILDKLGEGGMGVVYKAEDTRLRRTVALKFLPPHAVENRERFLREAQAAAALDHPNVCTVYELGESDDRIFLAMAYVDGHPVSDKIRERPLKLQDALDVAIQAAEGLRAAHDKGIVHRDIKSANLMVTREGQVKITDFGLAHLVDGTRLTKTNTVAGTPAYMSPEQAQAQPVDRRTDIWSLGVVLYEMTTGRLPFQGEREEATLYSIIHSSHEPITALRVGVPAELDWIVGKAMAKDREQRYQHVDDLIVDLGRLRRKLSDPEAVAYVPAGEPPAPVRSHPRLLYAALAVVCLFALGISFAYLRERSQTPETPLRRFALTPDSLSTAEYSAAISPDGRRFVYVSTGGGGNLWVRDMDREEPRMLAGTEGARSPFWSPDSADIAYFTGKALKRVRIDRGTPATVSEVAGEDGPTAAHGAWSPGGRSIAFVKGGFLYEVPAQGGAPKTVRLASAGAARDVSYLPQQAGGRQVLASLGQPLQSMMVVLNLDTGGVRELRPGAYPVYAPSGHVLYQPQRNLPGVWAAPFSVTGLQMTGDPFPVAEDATLPSVSSDGTLLIVDPVDRGKRQLVWRDRRGSNLGAIGQPRHGLQHPVLSPDGRQVVFQATGEQNRDDLWIHDLGRGMDTRLTSTSEAEILPVWSPTSDRIAYSRFESPTWNIRVLSAGGAGEPQLILGSNEEHEYATAWSEDGAFILTTTGRAGTNDLDLGYLRRSSAGSQWEAAPLLKTRFQERLAALSPDGRYYAYCSNESGRDEVYMRPFPKGDVRRQVSHDGGCGPVWGRNGKELFYVEGDKLMAAPVATAPDLSVRRPVELFRNPGLQANVPRYGVSRDSQRFLIAEPVEGKARKPRSLHIVENWFAEFRNRGVK